MLTPRMPELSALEVFATVAAAGSLNAAASVLGISQQAVSARVTALERQIGISLFDRTSKGSSLTATGSVVYEWISRLLASAAEVDAGLAGLRSDAATTLRVAASYTIAEYLLPRWLVTFHAEGVRQHRSAVVVELTVANSTSVADLVRTGAVDIGLVEGPLPPKGLRHRTIGHDRLVVVVPPNHPWATRGKPISADLFARTPLVAREYGSGTREVLAAAVKRSTTTGEESVPPALSFPTTAAVRSAVIAGAGPAVLSELAVVDDIAAGRLHAIEVTGLDLIRSLRAVWRGTGQPAAATARSLLEIAARGVPLR